MVNSAKEDLARTLDALANVYRTTMEMDREKVYQSVRVLNESAFALVEQKVRPRSPRGDCSVIDC